MVIRKSLKETTRVSKFTATVLYNEGYGKQCMNLLVEALSKEEAKGTAKEKAVQMAFAATSMETSGPAQDGSATATMASTFSIPKVSASV